MYDNSLSLGTRIAARVENVEGFTSSTPVVFIGAPNYHELYMRASAYFPKTASLTGVSSLPIGSYSTRTFFRYFVGINFAGPSSAQRTLLLLDNTDMITSMPSYPEKGSAAYYEGMVLVKLSDGSIS